MYEMIIKNYINNLTKNDITYFALKNDISLTDQELDFVYKTIKKNYKILLSPDYESIFNEAKNYLSHDSYIKIYNLFLEYKAKYNNFSI